MSPRRDRGRPSRSLEDPPGPCGRVLAAVLSAVLALASVGFAFLSGAWGLPDGRTGAALVGRGLLVSAVAGVAAVGCACLALGRRCRWPALALGLLPVVTEVLWLVFR
jgi:hypothetical protein